MALLLSRHSRIRFVKKKKIRIYMHMLVFACKFSLVDQVNFQPWGDLIFQYVCKSMVNPKNKAEEF